MVRLATVQRVAAGLFAHFSLVGAVTAGRDTGNLAFERAALAERGGSPAEVGDGGFTPWTRKLLGNAKERLLTSGLGVDRLATLV